MISVIICHRSPLDLEKIKSSIANTIGVSYELVVIDNSKNKYSIFAAYNEGLKYSTYDICCLVHEDVIFHTINWGATVIEHFKDDKLGCLGVAGADYKLKAPSGWWQVPQKNWALNIIQHFKDGRPAAHEFLGWNSNKTYREVAIIDGVFIALNKKNNVKFDEFISGFHGYDTDYSLSIRQKGLKVYATNEILIEHFSSGTISKEWYIAMDRVHRKHEIYLPSSTYCSEPVDSMTEVYSLETFINGALDHGLKTIALHYWRYLLRLKPISKVHFRILSSLLSKAW